MKRSFDFCVALLLLILLMPLLLLIATLIRWRMGPPVLFQQDRAGLKGKIFRLVKFRTMNAAHGPDGRPLPDEERLARLGSLLRTSSLDELPELWNVLKGDMSLVGPRPLLLEYVPLYSPQQARRHDVRPGITGWAQINGRNELPWPRRFEMDVWYVDNQSFALDLRILVKTINRIFRADGISAKGHATMPPFAGKDL